MKTPLSKVLVVLLVVDIVVGVLVTPAGGMDPRPPSGASGLTWACVGTYMVGLILCLAAVVQLVRGKAVGPTLALIGPLFFSAVLIADRTDHFHAEVAPAAIRALEWSVAGLSLVVIAVASMVRTAARAGPAPG
jgi:hypothetical protein